MVSNKLKAKIVENGLTQEIIAKHIGISIQALNSKINKKNEFTLREVSAIAEILNLSDEEIGDVFIRD